MSVLNFVTQDQPIEMALPKDQLNHFIVETFFMAIFIYYNILTSVLITFTHKIV